MWQQVVFLIALAASQIAAAPEEKQLPIHVENIRGGSSRILSGWDAKPGQHPHHVNLRIVSQTGDAFICGGSVISREWVLSAAHCTKLFDYVVVRAGMVRVVDAVYVQESREWYNHPTYSPHDPNSQPNDITLIKVPVPIPFSSLLKPIRLAPLRDQRREYTNRRLVATGHGRLWTNGDVPEVLQWVYLRGVAQSICARTFQGNVITANSMCAGFYNVTSQSVCHGDSGGPLVDFEEDGEPIQVGIASFVAGLPFGCHSEHPGAFCRTAPFHPWLTSVTGLNFENLDEEDRPPKPEPPATEPPATEPPPTEPPPTEPPPTEPPLTEPPATEPPPTEPPTTEPPTTEPPVTEPPTEPPTTPQPDEDDDSSEEDDDEDTSKILKMLKVKVNVKVKLAKGSKSIKHVHRHNATITRHR